MTSRRSFLAGLLATGLAPTATWADAGGPKYLSAARLADGRYALCGIGGRLDILFQIALPARGHAAVAHPTRPEAIAFARRPGTFAVVINCLTGETAQTLTAAQGRHFYGHGVFSRDGRWLYTTENDYDAARGVVGVWDASAGYRRVGEFDSGGIGPHDIKRLPNTDTLVIANGGIETHPDAGRTKLNIPTMASNLSYITDGAVTETVRLNDAHQRNSIRHLTVADDGTVGFGMQWQGDGQPTALVGTHRINGAVQLDTPNATALRAMNGYVGSIAFSGDGTTLATTSPRGGVVQLTQPANTDTAHQIQITDVGGVAPTPTGFIVTNGTGLICQLHEGQVSHQQTYGLSFDNHLVPV